MADIFGHPIPQGGVRGTLATVAVVSIPVALALAAGYGAYRSVRFVARRLRPETPEEAFERLRKAAYRIAE